MQVQKRHFAALALALLLAGTAVRGLAQETAAATPVAAPAAAQTAESGMTDAAQRIYQRFGAAVYQVQVIDRASGKKAAIGSGFQLDGNGLLATNYHVVADVIQQPENNRLEFLHEDGTRGNLQLLAVDVINDLALLRMEKPGPVTVELGTSDLRKGTRLFSLGNPHDIGFTIVEGIHNGFASDSFHDKIHFSGAINEGMSGGPTLSADGRVVGINVMTGGNQIGFLVPVEKLKALVSKEAAAKIAPGEYIKHAHDDIEQQLVASQAEIMRGMLDPKYSWESVNFGPLKLPGRLHNAMKCWGAPAHEDKDPYRHFWQTCYNEDSIYLNENFDTGVYYTRYDLIEAKDDLWLPRFYTYYEDQYAQAVDSSNGGEGDVTNFTCNDGFVDQAGHRFKTSFCIRQYEKYHELYDAHLYMAMVDGGRTGMIVVANALGVTRDNALAFAKRFLHEIGPRDDGNSDAEVPAEIEQGTPVSPEQTMAQPDPDTAPQAAPQEVTP